MPSDTYQEGVHGGTMSAKDTSVPLWSANKMDETGISSCRPGDVVRIQLFDNPVKAYSTLLLRVERCDDRHQILYGAIVSESFVELGRSLRRGAKLGVAYHLVRENVHIVNLKET
jgi:hypothetical protein